MLQELPPDADLALHRLLGPRPVYFVGSNSQTGRHHLCAATNVTSVSVDPPLVAIALWPSWETTGNILRTKRLTLSLATAPQVRAVLTAGHRYTGVDLPPHGDKYLAAGLTAVVPSPGYPAGVAESVAVLACNVTEVFEGLGDHVVMVAKIASAWAEATAFSANLTLNIANVHPLMQMAGLTFASAGPLAT